MEKIIFAAFILSLSYSVQANSWVKRFAFGYCNITHPIEMFNNIRHDNTCEEQHVIQKQYNGSNLGNISIISVSSHIATDSWNGNGVMMQGKVWDNAPSKDGWGTSEDAEKALAQAYKLGRWQLEYVFLLYDYRTNGWSTTVMNWDGMSHATYVISWWTNLPAKYFRKTAYLLHKERYSLLIDHIIQLPVLLLEGCVGVLYSLVGVVIGTVLQPVDTLNAIIGGVYLTIKAIVLGIIDFFLSLFLLIKAFV
ncbi:MAG: hypothetical protein KAT04_03925 [Methylococcales bacterium]|nr:hypothetical protein [Methylococcales bacterium]